MHFNQKMINPNSDTGKTFHMLDCMIIANSVNLQFSYPQVEVIIGLQLIAFAYQGAINSDID